MVTTAQSDDVYGKMREFRKSPTALRSILNDPSTHKGIGTSQIPDKHRRGSFLFMSTYEHTRAEPRTLGAAAFKA